MSKADLLLSGSGYSVTITNREEVRAFYNTVYQASENVPINWTGDAATCNAGATAVAFRDAVARRVNFYRAMAGVPATIVLDATYNTNGQKAALMMSVNDNLSHSPPSSWLCYTPEGATAAGNSNLALGRDGSEAIDNYVEDFGSGNFAAGHRRWVLYPQTQTMGTGDIPFNDSHCAANALWVFDGHYDGPRPTTRDGFVSWPPPGYAPYQLVYSRWSFSLSNADFSNATASLSTNGVTIPVTIETVVTNYGENTLVWHPSRLSPDEEYSWPRPAADTTYNVTISNVIFGDTPHTYSYSVKIFDPTAPGPDTVVPVVSGSDSPTVGRTNFYTFNTVPLATGYQWRQARRDAFTAMEGAENGLAYFTADVSPGYCIVTNNPVASGAAAFHLAHPEPGDDQTLTYTRILLPGTNSLMRFKSRLGWALPDQVANVEVSIDEGRHWTTVYSQAGTETSGETIYNTHAISLANYADHPLLVRFHYVVSAGGYYYCDTSFGVGWYIDDVSFSDTEELTSLAVSHVAGASFNFIPARATNYVLQTRAQVFNEFYLEWGPVKRVIAVATSTPDLNIVDCAMSSATQFQLDFTVNNYRSSLTFLLYKAGAPCGPWTNETTAGFQTLASDSKFRFTSSIGDETRLFFRVSAR